MHTKMEIMVEQNSASLQNPDFFSFLTKHIHYTVLYSKNVKQVAGSLFRLKSTVLMVKIMKLKHISKQFFCFNVQYIEQFVSSKF